MLGSRNTKFSDRFQCGIGRFHWMLLAACGMGLAADTCELLVLAFVLPSAEVDFCITETEKRVLGKSYRSFNDKTHVVRPPARPPVRPLVQADR